MPPRKDDPIALALQQALDAAKVTPQEVEGPATYESTKCPIVKASGKQCLGRTIHIAEIPGYSLPTTWRICGWDASLVTWQPVGEICCNPQCNRPIVDRAEPESIPYTQESILPRPAAHVFVPSMGVWLFAELVEVPRQ